ncbi:hypothetical protein [Herminiimonas sp. CN]|uniref:hypothetical protein n=1 Tax=Herminiimonas sp. CN TaxID=1349818 RepID=UPI0004732C6B|nr:hypothetical protein [Herminiimonas sp. CN]
MSALVDKAARLAAMANLAKHFLSQTYEGGNTAAEREARHEAIKREVSPCGLFDAHDVVWLFYLLEERALTEINKFAALAQTTDPDAVLKYGVPSEIVENAKLLKEHHVKATKRAGTASARAAAPGGDKDKEECRGWLKTAISMEDSGVINSVDITGMKGFNWGGRDNKWLKARVKEVFPKFEFRRGRTKEK